uniref:Uncharacterized protein n=1 Tax=viral metagenome TaxID=1070528 RepID=A0A6M3LWB9_9ZZZZ
MRQMQQGDVLFQQVRSVPRGAKKLDPSGGLPDRKSYVLVEGEMTGHAHTVDAAPDVELYEHDGVLYLKVADKATVKHQEHNEVAFTKGVWEVGRVVEYDYDDAERRMREVQD